MLLPKMGDEVLKSLCNIDKYIKYHDKFWAKMCNNKVVLELSKNMLKLKNENNSIERGIKIYFSCGGFEISSSTNKH